MNQHLLKVSGLSVSRGGHTLLSGLDFTLHAGQVVVVLGPNGAGKSSLLLALAGLIPAIGGIELLGQPLREYARDDMARALAWQGELPPAEFGLTVRQRLELAAGKGGAAVDQAADEMEIVGLLHRSLGELSAGERQRTELAALMVRDTPVWLLDEPTAHLDLRHQVSCIRMLRQQRAAGRAMLVVLHDIPQALAVADATIVVDGHGGGAYGEAGLPGVEKLSQLYGTPLLTMGDNIFPDYGDQL